MNGESGSIYRCSNFYHCLKAEFKTASIDFGVLIAHLVGNRELVRVYYYNAPVPQSQGEEQYRAQQKFFAWLQQIPYFTVRLGRLEKRPHGMVEKDVDIKIAVDMLHLAFGNVYDTAILISGDGDFAYVVEAVEDLGKHVENAFPGVGSSQHLRNSCDRFVRIDENLMKKCARPPIT